ncbi:hypothetical protein F4803DRAFT_252389 [Xylaria telfairii]|nr:hypothetical protein F4803DRAFT_252389 [Xylaria telfairii]
MPRPKRLVSSADWADLVVRFAGLSINDDVSGEPEELSSRLIRNDAASFFIQSCKESLTDWILLIRKTTVPLSIRHHDSRIVAALKTVDSYIINPKDIFLKRLAYIQLASVLKTVSQVIAIDRSNGLFQGSHGRRDATLTADIYQRVHKRKRNKTPSRSDIHELHRTARRWVHLTGPSPFLLVIYSSIAEAIM